MDTGVTSSSDSDEETAAEMAGLAACAATVVYQQQQRLQKSPQENSAFGGQKWVAELLAGNTRRFHNILRMSKQIFIQLVRELQREHGLRSSSRITPTEVIAITLFILAHNESMRSTSERFQYSTETVSRYFHVGTAALCSLARTNVKAEPGSFTCTTDEIATDQRYMPYFKDCIGAIDGTHIHARVPAGETVAYIGRSGTRTQNVLVVVDFKMRFTFIMVGWEGSAHDSRILSYAMNHWEYNFPYPPVGKYYVVDAGFPMQRGFLKPYPDTKYHLPDFQRSQQVTRGSKECFNKRHSSLRGVVERVFGLWKKKWAILRDMPSYSLRKQSHIVVATCTLHNYIRFHSSDDIDDAEVECYDVPSIHNESTSSMAIEQSYGGSASTSSFHLSDSGMPDSDAQSRGLNEMVVLRDAIAAAIFSDSNI